MIKFTKMHAIGNDFVVVDLREHPIDDPSAFSRSVCHRHFGIGADQVLLLDSSERGDFRMGIFNADGSEVEMCGNGIRAIAKYVWSRGMSDKSVLDIETLAGIIHPERSGDMVRVDMGVPEFDGPKSPVALEGRVVDHPLHVEDRTFEITCVGMGNPHAVIFVDDVEGFPVEQYGRVIERHELFPNRVNVEFVRVESRDSIRMRVWERGTGETMACGTGATATAVAAMLKGLVGQKVTVRLLGGELLIEWTEGGRAYMTGPATEVYNGEIGI